MLKNVINGAKTDSIGKIISLIDEITAFYPTHIEKEDKNFFIPVMKYFSQEEQDAMLAEMYQFDQKLIHEKYTKVVVSAEEALNQQLF